MRLERGFIWIVLLLYQILRLCRDVMGSYVLFRSVPLQQHPNRQPPIPLRDRHHPRRDNPGPLFRHFPWKKIAYHSTGSSRLIIRQCHDNRSVYCSFCSLVESFDVCFWLLFGYYSPLDLYHLYGGFGKVVTQRSYSNNYGNH